jgi:flagellar biosynthesis anti-sigma factor FlgM
LAQAAVPQADSVTLSAAAQSSAQLLNAAQNATGIDHAAVASIRAQLAAGSYNISPENLAQAIATVLKETKS